MFLLDRVTTLPKDYRNITKTLPDKLIKKPNITKRLPKPYRNLTKTLPSNTYPRFTQHVPTIQPKHTHNSPNMYPQFTQTPLQRYSLLFIELKIRKPEIKLRLLIIRLVF